MPLELHPTHRRASFWAVCLVVVVGHGAAWGQSAWFEGFEGPQPSWREAGADAQHQLEAHQRVQGQAHTGNGCEWLKLAGTGGTYVYLSHDVGRPRVIDEMLPTVWVKSDRPGICLSARLVLPRTEDPRSGRPVTTLVRGASYTQVHAWQQLRVENIPASLAQQVRLLRTQLGSQVDGREAYVDQIFLNVYGGPGVTNVWIDDLDIAGYVSQAPTAVTPAEPLSSNRAAAPVTPRDVKLVGSVLQVDSQPIFPRVIQYQGEPLPRLKALGFNAVWLPRPATAEMLREADELGLWLVCPPPNGLRSDPAESAMTPPEAIGPQYQAVLAWDLGWGLSGDELQATRQWATQTRAADGRSARPLVCRPDSDLRSYSRYVDLLLVGKPSLGSSLELSDYGTWLRERPRLARPGTPFWSTVQTQPAISLSRQWIAAGHRQPLPAFGGEQIRLLVYTSVASGSRGLLFESYVPLDDSDPAGPARAGELELLNLELDLIRPWLAAGTFVTMVGSTEPEIVGALLRTDRARLLLPIWVGPGAQFVPGQAAKSVVSFVVPGVPESNNAYLFGPDGLEPLRHKRVTGGVQVTIDEFSLSSAVLLTQEPTVISSVTQRAAAIAARTAELRRQLAAWKLQDDEQVLRHLAAPLAPKQAADHLRFAHEHLAACDKALAARDYRAASLSAERAMRPLRILEREAWQQAVAAMGSPVAGPATVAFSTLPWHQLLLDQIRTSQLGANRLPCGDAEDLQAMIAAGWRHFACPSPQLQSKANLAGVAAHTGCAGIRLVAQPAQSDSPPVLVETPSVWITSPPVPVEAGSLVSIQGWVCVPEPITGSVDGLMIVDSLAGEALAARIGKTTNWQPFHLYRVAPQSGTMSVSFVLSGLGEAWIDDISIQPLCPLSPRPRAPRSGRGEELGVRETAPAAAAAGDLAILRTKAPE